MVYSDHPAVTYLVNKKGFRLSEATYLVNAGFDISQVIPIVDKSKWEGFEEREALFWKAAGFDLKNALQWRNANFSPQEGLGWSIKGFKLQDAIVLQRVDLTSGEVNPITDLTPWPEFSDAEILVWKAAGFLLEEAKRLKGDRFYPKRALIWRGKGFHVDAMICWARAGFSLCEAKEWAAIFAGSGDPEDLKLWKDKSFSPKETKIWKEQCYSFYEALEWKKTGIQPEAVIKWRENGFTPEEAAILHAANLAINGVVKIQKTDPWPGFSKEDELVYKTLHYTPDRASQWKDLGFTAVEFVVWVQNFDPQSAFSWKNHGFLPKDATLWGQCHFSPDIAAEWRDKDFLPDAAKIWQDAVFSPALAAEWRDNRISLTEAVILRGAGFVNTARGLTIEFASKLQKSRKLAEWLQVWGDGLVNAQPWVFDSNYRDKPKIAKRLFDQGRSPKDTNDGYKQDFSSPEGNGQTGSVDSDLDTGPG